MEHRAVSLRQPVFYYTRIHICVFSADSLYCKGVGKFLDPQEWNWNKALTADPIVISSIIRKMTAAVRPVLWIVEAKTFNTSWESTMWTSVSRSQNDFSCRIATRYVIGHFKNASLQAVDCTGRLIKATPTTVEEAFIFYLWTFFATHRYRRETT